MRTTVAIVVLVASTLPARADRATGVPIFIEDAPVRDPADDGRERYLTLGLLSKPTDGGWFGLRAQLDLASVAGFAVGVGGALAGGRAVLRDASAFTASGTAFLAYTTPALWRDRVKLRAQLGLGGRYAVEQDQTTLMVTRTTSRLVEGALLLDVRATHDWAFVAGPIVQTAAGDTSAILMFGIARRW